MSGMRDRGQNGTGLGTRGSPGLTLLFFVLESCTAKYVSFLGVWCIIATGSGDKSSLSRGLQGLDVGTKRHEIVD